MKVWTTRGKRDRIQASLLGGCREGHDLVTLELLHAGGELHNLHLDEGVLLGADSLASRTVVIGTDLVVAWGEDRVSLAKRDLLLLAELLKLPADERVVVRVDAGGDEGASPIDLDTHGYEVILGDGGKVLQPKDRIDKSGWAKRLC